MPNTVAETVVSHADDEVIDFLDVLLLFSRHRSNVLRCVAASIAVSVVIALLVPRWYEARASLLPPQSNQQTTALMAGQLSALTGMSARDFGMKNPIDLYVGLLGSESITSAMVERFHLRAVYGKRLLVDARKTLVKKSNIAAGKDGLIVITVEDRSAQRAAELANGYMEELQRLNQRLALTEAGQRRLFYEQQLSKTRDDLVRAEAALGATQKQTGMIDLEGNAKALVEQIAEVRGQLVAKEAEVHAMRAFATRENPDVRIAQEQANALRTQLARLEKGTGEGATGSTGTLSGAALEYARKLRELKYQETLFELLSRQYESARLDEGKEGSVVQVVDTAIASERPAGPNRVLIVVLGTLLGYGLGGLRLLLQEAVARASGDPVRQNKVRALAELWRIRRAPKAEIA